MYLHLTLEYKISLLVNKPSSFLLLLFFLFFKGPITFEAIQILETGRKILENHLNKFIPHGNLHREGHHVIHCRHCCMCFSLFVCLTLSGLCPNECGELCLILFSVFCVNYFKVTVQSVQWYNVCICVWYIFSGLLKRRVMDCSTCQYKTYICSSGQEDCGGILSFILLYVCMRTCWWVGEDKFSLQLGAHRSSENVLSRVCQCVPECGSAAACTCAELMKKIICVILM